MGSEHPTSILTRKQRDWLGGHESPTQERTMRSRVHDRVRAGLTRDIHLVLHGLESGELNEQTIVSDVGRDELREAIAAQVAVLYRLGNFGHNVDVEKCIREGLKRGQEQRVEVLKERLQNDPSSLTIEELTLLRQAAPEVSDRVNRVLERSMREPVPGRVAPDAPVDDVLPDEESGAGGE